MGHGKRNADTLWRKGRSVDRDQYENGAIPNPPFTRATTFARSGGQGSGKFYEVYSDPGDAIANHKKLWIEIYHIPTGNNVFFKAFLTGFQDNFKPDYNKEMVFGRMDPIVTYKYTSRSISISWNVPSVNLAEAKENMAKANMLVQMLYPVYESGKSCATTMKSGPIFKVKFGNLIIRPGANKVNGAAKEVGLPCVIEGFSYKPKLDEGFFDPASKTEITPVPPAEPSLLDKIGQKLFNQEKARGTVTKKHEYDGALYPQTIEVSLELTVLHDSSLGWDELGNLRDADANENGRFPYGGDNKAAVEEILNKREPPDIVKADWKAQLDLQKDLANRRLRVRANKLLQPVKDIKKFLGV